MPSSVEYTTQYQSPSPLGEALARIAEDEEGSLRAASIPSGSVPYTEPSTRTRSARTGDSRRTRESRSRATDSIRTGDRDSVRTGDSILASDISGATSEKTTSTTVEKHHSSHRKGNRHVIHEKIITHETRGGTTEPASRHHTIIITDPEAAARREKRRAEREAQQARRAERELRREQRRERRERHETRKAHAREMERLMAILQSQSRSRSSSRRSPITPTTRTVTGTVGEDELHELRNALAESEKYSESLLTKLREMTDRLELESKRASTAESNYKEYSQRLRSAEVARKKAEADAMRESEESSRLKIIYETARAQQEHIQRELDALQDERDEAEQLAADARTKARKFQEQLLVTQAREAGRREGRREAKKERKHRHHEKEKVVERIIERVQAEEPTPQIVTESVVYDEEEDTESRRTTPRAHTPDLPQRDPSPIPPPPPPIIPPQHSGHGTDTLPDLPDPPLDDIQMPEVVDPAPLPPIGGVGGSTWSNWKNKIGGKLRRSNSRSESYSQDSYLDDPGMYAGGRPAYPPSDRDNPSRSQYERDAPSRSQITSPERDIPSRTQSRTQYHPPEPPRSHYDPPVRDIPSRSYTTQDRSPSPEYLHSHPHPQPPPLVPPTSMTGVGSMAGIGGMSGMTGMSGMSGVSGMTGLTTLVPGPGSGPGPGPGSGPVPGPSTLHMPPPPQEMKASRKSSRRAKSNMPPPQPVFPPPPVPEAPIHPVPYHGLASPWHHKPAPILPEGWIPEADDEGHIELPPAHEIHPSPLMANNDLGERSNHPIVPSAPHPRTPKHRAGSHPTAPYAPMVIPPDEEYYDDDDDGYSDEDDSLEIPIASGPFDPLAVRTPAHYGRPLSVIPELSPEYQAPPIPDAPLPSTRHSSRSKYSQPMYRQEQDSHSATSISIESGADATVHRSIRRRPSSLTPTSPAPPVVQQHVPDDPRTPPRPIVPIAQIPVAPISPESVPPPPRKTKADRHREREAERAQEQAWEKEQRDRTRQTRERERLDREQQQKERDRKAQEQRAREAYEIERKKERERKEQEREARHRERERKDSERERRERERDLREQEKEQRRQRRDSRDRTERRRTYNPTPAAPIVSPNPVVVPSPAPAPVPLGEDRQITFPMPHVSPPEQIVGGPSVIVDPPSMIVGGPSTIGSGPARMVGAPTHIGAGPTHIGAGPTHIGAGPTHIGAGPTHIGAGPTQIGEGPRYMAKPSEKIVPPIIPPPPIPDGHYTPYSPMSGPESAGTEGRRRSYNYAPATSATPITPHNQPGPSSSVKMPTPEPWNDPANPRRRADADEAAISAYVRAVEQARKLAAGEEEDEEEEETMQRYVKAKFGDQSGNPSDDEDESEEQPSEDSDSQSSSELTESESSGTASDHWHPGIPTQGPYHPPNRDPDAQSQTTNVPTIILESPSNDSSRSSALTDVSDARLLNPSYQPAPRHHTDHGFEDPMEYETNSLENEPLDLSDIPPVPGAPSFDPYPNSAASPSTRHYGLPSDYVDAPRVPRYSSASVNRPPPLASNSDYNSRWGGPPRPPSMTGLQPPGLPDFTGFEELDNFKYGSNSRPPRSNPSRTSGRDSASSVSRSNGHPAPPPVIITPANTSQPSTQRTANIDLAPPSGPERTPNSSYPSTPGFASRVGAGLSSLGFSRPSFMRSGSQEGIIPPRVNAPTADSVPPRPPVLPSPVPSRSPMPPSQAASRAPSGMGTRPEINRVRDTMGPSLQVPMAGSPIRPNVTASKPPPQQPKGFPLTRPASRFTDRNKNKTRAQVEAFQAIRDEQDLERQRQWDVGHGRYGGDSPDKDRPPSPQGSARSRKSRAVTVVSTEDEDEWTTGRSHRGRLN